MSVYTTVGREELAAWLLPLKLGELIDHAGIAAGMQNSNYFVTTTAGRFVMLYITLDATIVGTGRPAYRYVTNAWEDLRNVAEAPVDVDSSSNIWGLLSSGASGER